MVDNPDHIEREVEERRARVESTLDALKERMSVNQLVDDLSQFVGVDDLRGMMHSAGRQVRENPIALGLIGVGLAWLAFGGGSGGGRSHDRSWDDWDTRDDYAPYSGERWERKEGMVSRIRHAAGDAVSTVTDAASSAGAKVSQALGGARERASEAGERLYDQTGRMRDDLYDQAGDWRGELSGRAGQWRDSAARRGAAMRDRAGQWREGASYQARRMGETMMDRMERQPLVVGAAAVAVGAVIGAAMPRTRTEDRWMGSTSDRLWREAKGETAALRDRAMRAARETLDTAVEAAREEGLVPEKGETLAAKLGRVAEAATSEAKAQVAPLLKAETDKIEDKAGSEAGSSGATDTATALGTGKASGP